MAFDLGAWLAGIQEQKNGEGKPLYAPETLQDIVAMIVLAGKMPIDKLSEPVAKVFGAFILRSGLDKAKAADFKKALDAYFKAHPLPAELIRSFQAEYRREPTGKKLKSFRVISG
jgi:hypothetical protein